MLPRFRLRLPRGLAGLLAAFVVAVAVPTPANLAAQAPSAPAPAGSAAKVWVNTNSGVYHCPGSRYYGATKAGTFLAESQARSRGYRPAYGRACTPTLATVDSGPAGPQSLASPEAGTRVWVNTSSGVYHCPGTRYYGTTRRGEYMSESRARAMGYRPAYGRGCSQESRANP